MMPVVPITCPYCGATLRDLKQVGRESKNGNPVFEYSCGICGSTFPLTSKHCMSIFRQTLKAAQKSYAKFCRSEVIR